MPKRKAGSEPMPEIVWPTSKPRYFYNLGSATPPVTGYDKKGRRIVVRQYEQYFNFEDDKIEKVMKMWVKETDSLASVFSKIEKHMGCEVALYQIIKKKTYKVDRNDPDGLNFGCDVHVKRVVDENVKPVVEEN